MIVGNGSLSVGCRWIHGSSVGLVLMVDDVGCTGARVVVATVVVGSSVSSTGIIVSTMMVVVPGGIPIVHLTLAFGVVVLIGTMKATPFYGSRPAASLPS